MQRKLQISALIDMRKKLVEIAPDEALASKKLFPELLKLSGTEQDTKVVAKAISQAIDIYDKENSSTPNRLALKWSSRYDKLSKAMTVDSKGAWELRLALVQHRINVRLR